MYICVRICLYVYMCICLYVYVYICIYAYMYICICVSMWVHQHAACVPPGIPTGIYLFKHQHAFHLIKYDVKRMPNMFVALKLRFHKFCRWKCMKLRCVEASLP